MDKTLIFLWFLLILNAACVAYSVSAENYGTAVFSAFVTVVMMVVLFKYE